MGDRRILNIKWVVAVLITLIIINAVLLVLTVTNIRKGRQQRSGEASVFAEEDSFYDTPCPDIEMVNSEGEKIALRDFDGNVIILRFTRMSLLDIPFLTYLEHIYGKHKKEGVHLVFIQLPGSESIPFIKKDFAAPIISDNGPISSAFHARVNDTIIVGRDFHIKFKHNLLENRIIYDQVLKHLYEGSPPAPATSQSEMTTLFKQITYLNLETEQIETIGEATKNRNSVINLFVAPCIGCPTHSRIDLLKDVSSNPNIDKKQLILLFARGNDIDLIRRFIQENGLSGLTVGVIQSVEGTTVDGYYRIFRLDIDPCLYIWDEKGEIVFSEEIKNQKKLTKTFLIEELT